MQLIKVKYVGKGDSVLTEYDGKKYCFSKTSPIQIIPLVVYNFMQDEKSLFRESIVPVTSANEEFEQQTKNIVENNIAKIEKSIDKEDTSKREVGRPKKSN